jgi:hypothetical protein
MALSGWNANQKFKLTIDGSKIDGDLENFPVNITLSSGTGITSYDTTDVFDALATDVVSGTSLFYKTDWDVSGQEHTFSVNGSPQLYSNTTPSGMLGSMGFSGSSEWLQTADSDDWYFGSGDFTVDFWVNFNTKAVRQRLLGQYESGDAYNALLIMYNTSSDTIYASLGSSSASNELEADFSGHSTGEWVHLAFVRNGNLFSLYINGFLGDSNTYSVTQVVTGSDFSIGRLGEYDGDYLNGYISEFRISKGIARWTSNFTPPTEPYTTDEYTKLLLHFEGDKSSSQHILEHVGTDLYASASPFLGKQSTYFNGSSDYISVAADSSFAFGGDFTISCFVRPNTTNTAYVYFGTTDHYSGADGWALGQTTTQLFFEAQYSGSWSIELATTNNLSTSEFSHLAVVRSGTTVTMYVNGISVTSTTDSPATSITNTNPLLIGKTNNVSQHYYFGGYLSDVLVVKGTALWTDDFLPGAGTPYNSWYNRHKIAITDSNDNKLNTEIAYWDDFNKTASLWTAVPTIASGTDTALTLYYDATTSGSATRSAAEASDDFTGIDGDPPDPRLWRYTITNNYASADCKIDSNRLYLRTRYDTTGIYIIANNTFWLSGDFDVQVDFELNEAPSVNWQAAFFIYFDSANYSYIGRRYNSGQQYFDAAKISNSWQSTTTTATSDTSGKYRFVRAGSSCTSYYWNGSSWTSIQTRPLSTGDARIGLIVNPESTSSNWISVWFDNFTVNSADLITGFTGDTGTAAAQAVWDTDYKLVCHFDDATLSDSSYSNNSATIAGADDTTGLIAKGRSFPDTADKITFSTSGYNTTNTYTIETLVKPTAESGVHLWEGDNVLSGPSLEGASSNLNFWVGNTSSLSTGALTQGEWQYVVARYDKTNTQQSLLIDAVEQGPNSVDVSDTFGSYFYLGNRGKSGGSGADTRNYGGTVDELRISSVARSDAWIKATHYSNFNDLITFGEASFASFVFSNATPAAGTVYGTTRPLYINVTVSGSEPSYVYDATFYDGGDVQIGTTVSGATNGSQVTRTLSTPLGTSYSWYVTATASGFSDTSDTYTFDNRFLCSGYTMVNGTRTSGIPVRLYRRSDGTLISGTTSAGVSGTFEIETLYNEDHYAVALHPNEEINALIYDHISP